jgi:hypothetical protein
MQRDVSLRFLMEPFISKDAIYNIVSNEYSKGHLLRAHGATR